MSKTKIAVKYEEPVDLPIEEITVPCRVCKEDSLTVSQNDGYVWFRVTETGMGSGQMGMSPETVKELIPLLERIADQA
jgi:hypothetical protein